MFLVLIEEAERVHETTLIRAGECAEGLEEREREFEVRETTGYRRAVRADRRVRFG